MNNTIKVFSGSANQILSKKIADAYGVPLGKISIQHFSDGEFVTFFEESVRGKDVFLIQPTIPPSDNILELLMMVDAAKRASARNIIAVVPYFGYARQDRKDKSRVAIGSKLIANMLTCSGITRIITLDLHADQIQGFFEVPVDHLFASTIFLPYIKENFDLKNLVIATPDTGGTKRASTYAKYLGLELVICYKKRTIANKVDEMFVIGDINKKDVLIIDDMIDTAGTIVKATEIMKKQGAKSIRAICTHPVLSGSAYKRIEKSELTEVITTDTIPLKKETKKIKVLSVSNLFADVLKNLVNHKSISSKFIV